ncbi:MAG: Gldg family protein [Clostridia bacterium]|nr:Gldg family protein [Clostridia bacterium]
MKRKSVLTKKKLKYGSAAVIFTVLFIAVVILFNGVFSALASRYGWYADMTEEAVFTLSERAREYVADVGADIDIIFAEEPDLLMADDDMRYVYTTAKQLEEAVDGVTVRCVNVVKDPSFFKEFYSTSATDITTRSVVVRSGTESKVLTPQSFFVYNEEYVRWGYQGEYRFVSAIMQVTQSETPVVCFTTRHGEKDFEKSSDALALAQLFYDCGFDVRKVDLSTEDIDEDCRVVVIIDPIYDFIGIEAEKDSANEIDKIDRFLDGFGGLLVFESPEHSGNLKNLNEFLREWGIAFRSDVTVRDLSNSFSTDGFTIFTEYQSDDTLGGSFYSDLNKLDSRPKAVISRAVPIDILWEEGGDLSGSRKASAMLKSPDGSELVEDGGTVETGSYNVLTMSLENRIIDNNNYYSYVMAVGSPSFASNSFLNSMAYGNRDIIYCTMKFVGRDGILADIDMKPFDDYTLTMTTKQANTMTAEMALILPVIAAAAGVVILVRRRRS